MNEVFFACPTCRVLVDAGYRWATSTLRGIVERRVPFSAARLATAAEYWSASGEDSEWLTDEVLPDVRRFLDAHADHELLFGDLEEIIGLELLDELDWLDVSREPDPGPRYFVEVLGLELWGDAITWVKEHREPWWWSLEDMRDTARRRFVEAVARSAAK
jgi:hypothetical protein